MWCYLAIGTISAAWALIPGELVASLPNGTQSGVASCLGVLAVIGAAGRLLDQGLDKKSASAA